MLCSRTASRPAMFRRRAAARSQARRNREFLLATPADNGPTKT
ncbi:hypothetical protein IOMTU133_2788 [Pseudomonas aeruginosa]|nr:hypothetical protein IOMTU133_2788 [Pseudomonas aeruginosa]